MRSTLLLKPEADTRLLMSQLRGLGVWAEILVDRDGRPSAVALAAHSPQVDVSVLEALPGVARALVEVSSHPLLNARRGRAVAVGALSIGPGHPPVLAAGPCAAESREQVMEAAEMAASCGATLLRGGAFKPRTSPYSFDGGGRRSLEHLREAADRFGLALVSELVSEVDVEPMAEIIDLVQIGTRNMQNFALLKRVGATGKPALLKRGKAASLEEWRLAGEHLLKSGASGVIFCERGILGADPETRNLLDLGGAAVMCHQYGLPVIADPSHGTGRRDLVLPMARAALAAGLNGLMVEWHPKPSDALSDGPQSLPTEALRRLGELIQASRA